LGQKMPLRLRICGRKTGAVEVDGAAVDGPVGEGLGEGDTNDPAGERLGDALRGDALGDDDGVSMRGLLGERDSPGETGDDGVVGDPGREPGGPAVEGEDAPGIEGGSACPAWAREPRPCKGTARSTYASAGTTRSTCTSVCTGVEDSDASSKSSNRAPRPVPAPWLGNNTGEYATSSNWSEAIEDECIGGGAVGDTGS
jgi:hypothetical protein